MNCTTTAESKISYNTTAGKNNGTEIKWLVKMQRVQFFWKAGWEHLWKTEIYKTSPFWGAVILFLSIYSIGIKGPIPIEYVQEKYRQHNL